jgi:pyridoxal 5'-phosphate synthase pdxS subunit
MKEQHMTGNGTNGLAQTGTWTVKSGLAQMLKGGVIMDVVTPDQAKIAEDAGACAVMALERVPSDIRASGGVSRMSDPEMIVGIMEAVTIPVMAKCRIGHFVEAQVLQALGVDYIDESEVLTPADEENHVYKQDFTIPFVCGARNLGEALRRIGEGAAMIRSKGEAGTGNIVEAVRHLRAITGEIKRVSVMADEELMSRARDLGAPYELVRTVAKEEKLPVVLFCAGGVATPSDAALVMQLGAEGVFVGSGIFKSDNPSRTAAAIVKATTNYEDPAIIAEASKGLGEPMRGIDLRTIPEQELMAPRGW